MTDPVVVAPVDTADDTSNTVTPPEAKAITEEDLQTKIECSIISLMRYGWIYYTLAGSHLKQDLHL
jgi:hypothetical protein